MKKNSLKELQQAAKEHFERLDVQKLYATTDGQFFLNAGRASLHAGSSHTVYPIEKAEVPGLEQDAKEPEAKPLAIQELKKLLPKMNMDELTAALMVETSGPNRKGATEAIEAQIATLLADGREKE